MLNKPTLTSSDVQKIMAACKAKAAEKGLKVAIAVVDDGGFLLGFERLDGAHRLTSAVAIGKARTAALMRRPTAAIQKSVQENPAIATIPDILPIQGGVPIVYEGECVGGIGVSGAQSHEDEDIGMAGVVACTTTT